ncbi:outer membrane protein TOM13-domain-containing protein [Lipomyces arxii]|uniref:outer membrane protein TOM13-domain-containing protein n=1 Tax=Lipomyces arxii TaxID=56418 RepID=UPI0034CFFEB4
MSTAEQIEKDEREVLALEAALLEFESDHPVVPVDSGSSSESDDESVEAGSEDDRQSVNSFGSRISEPGITLRYAGGTLWRLFKFSAINLMMPFINGMMLGFGEILANEIGIRWGYFGAEVHPIRRNIERQVERRRQPEIDSEHVLQHKKTAVSGKDVGEWH